MRNKIFIAVALFGLSTLIASCTAGEGAPTPAQTSSSGAQTVNVATQFRIPTNANGNTIEQQNIMDRQKVTSDPTKILWMHLVDLNGRIYLRTPVRGKITSSTKRLEPVTVAAGVSGGEYRREYGKPIGDQLTSELIQIDGTYGTSDPYVYWFDPRGYYYQFGQGYILSDMPINTKAPVDEITGLYNIDEAAKKWSQSQIKGGIK